MFEETTTTFAGIKSTAVLLKKKYDTARRPNTDAVTAVKAAAHSGLQALHIAIQSAGGAYAYPIKGLAYLTQHLDLFQPVFKHLMLMALASVAIVAALFFFTYVPQMGILFFVTGPLAPIVAFFLVLAEAFFAISFLFKAWIEPIQDDVFDAVLLQQGLQDLVARGREVKASGGRAHVINRLGKRVHRSLQKFTPEALLQYLITLPLNFIPVVGTAAFLVINGTKHAMGIHARYFQLKGFNPEQAKAYVDERRGAYMGFGVVALALNLVPFVNSAFAITNTIGAAIWAADMEKKAASRPDGAAAQADEFRTAQLQADREWKRIES